MSRSITQSIRRVLTLESTVYSPIALELDGRCIRAAQLARSGRSRTFLHAFSHFSLPEGPSGLSNLLSVLGRRGFHGNNVALCAPSRLLDSDLLTLPDSKVSPTHEVATDIIRKLLGRATRTSPDDLEVAHWLRRGDSAGLSAYVVALRHAEAQKLIAPFEAAGCVVVSIGCAASAIGELMHHFGHPDTCSAVLRLGEDAHSLILAEGRQIIYHRSLDAAGWKSVFTGHSETAAFSVSPPVRAHLGLVADETSSTLHCVPRTFGSLDVKRLYVSGEHAHVPGVVDYLQQSLPGATLLDLTTIGTSPGLSPLTPRMDVAMGLALAEVST